MTGSSTSLTIPSLGSLPANSGTFLIAGWIRADDLGDAFTIINDTGAKGLSFAVTSTSVGSSTWTASAKDSAGAQIFAATSVVGISIQSGWCSFALSGDMTTMTLQLLVNLSMGGISASWSSNHDVEYPNSDPWQIGAPTGQGINMSDFRFGVGEGFFDLTDSAQVAKLFAPGNHPLSWGPDGSLVTGSVPVVYLHGDDLGYPANLGSGGGFTVNGAPLINFSPGPT
jgi:hypothetical protein